MWKLIIRSHDRTNCYLRLTICVGLMNNVIFPWFILIFINTEDPIPPPTPQIKKNVVSISNNYKCYLGLYRRDLIFGTIMLKLFPLNFIFPRCDSVWHSSASCCFLNSIFSMQIHNPKSLTIFYCNIQHLIWWNILLFGFHFNTNRFNKSFKTGAELGQVQL